MSERDREQLRQWLRETECINVVGASESDCSDDEDPDEREVDHIELQPVHHSDVEDNAEQEVQENVFDAPVSPEVNMEVEENQLPPPIADPILDKPGFDNREFYVGKNKTTRWYLEPQNPRRARTPQHNIIPHFHRPGPTDNAKNATTSIQTLECILDNEMQQKIVEYTNIYIDKIRGNYDRPRDAKPTNLLEIKSLLGLLYLAGVLHANRRSLFEMWDMSKGTGVELAYVTMSEHRFRFLMRCIRFDNIHTRNQRKAVDKLAAIREMFEKFVSNSQNTYKPSDYLTIDEQLVAFRGNCPFRVYMPSKPAKYGIKVFALVSTTNFVATKLEVYVGQQPNGPFQQSNGTIPLVLRLVEPVVGTNRNITCDNWFASVPLALTLREEKSLTFVSTLRKNKPEIPLNFLPDKEREVKSSIFGFQDKCTMVSYVPKKNKAVVCISTMHHDGAIDPSTGDEKKPAIITTYNETKYGVDILDKMCRQYDVARNTKRWPLVLFFHIMNVAGVNALNIYRANKNYAIVCRRNYLKDLAFELVKPAINERISNENIPREIRRRGKLLLHLDEEAPPEQPAGEKGRCYLCGRARNKTSRKFCSKCKKWVCPDHQKSVCNQCLE